MLYHNLFLCDYRLIGLFKKYLTENEGKEASNMVYLFLDIDAYFSIGKDNKDKNDKQKKDVQANFIHK